MVLLMLVVAPFGPLAAQAQVSCGTPGADPATCIPSGASTLPSTATTPAVTDYTSTSPENATAVGPKAATPLPPTGPDTTGCSVWSGPGIALCISNIVYVFTVGIGSGFAYVAAYFFDFAVSLSLNSAAYALTFVSTGWTTARDIANMAFLFILIYIAFIIMFEADTTGTVQMLAAVVVVALLVNFSFFFTRLVIDAGNILSIQFYNAIQADPISTTSGLAGAAATATTYLGQSGNTKDLTGSIMGMLNLQGLFNNTSFQVFTSGQSGLSGFLTTLIASSFLYIAAGIMLWLLAVAFFTNGIKFLVRIVVLWFLIIASPLAFVARAVKPLEGYYYQWQKLLISHAFYPVAFMFIFLILTNFATQLSGNNSQNLIQGIFGGISAGSTTGGSYIATIGVAIANVSIRLGFVIIVLYLGFEAAKQISVMGAKAAEKGGNWFGGKMLAFPAWGLRNTAGRGFAALSKSPGLNERAEQKGFAGALWRSTSRVTRGLGNATYDVRNARPIAGLMESAKINVGKPATEGFSAQAKALTEKHEKESKERKAIIREAANREALKRVVEETKTGRPHKEADLDRIKNLGKPEFAKMKGDEIKDIAHLLSESQHKNIQEDEDRPFEEKQAIKKIADPIIKAQKIVVDDLRKLNNNLTTIQSDVIREATKKGELITLTKVDEMQNDINNHRMNLKTKMNAPGVTEGEKEELKSDLGQLRGATKDLRELKRNLENVVKHANRGDKEFVTY